MEKSKYQIEFEALPAWAQKMVSAAAGVVSYGGGHRDMLAGTGHPEKYEAFHVGIEREHFTGWFAAFCDMKDFADALTAPWPKPDAPVRERRAFNVVELMSDVEGDDGGGFVEPCAFGSLVPGHAVYCHNEAWPNSPRKCRRNRDDYRHEDCPGFVANPDMVARRG